MEAMRALKSIGAIVAGLIVAVLVVMASEFVISMIYPPPAGVDLANREAMTAAIAKLPAGIFAGVLIGWAAATVSGGWLAGKLAGRAQAIHGLIVGMLMLIAGVANMLMFPHPVWMWVSGILILLVGGYLGGRLAVNKA